MWRQSLLGRARASPFFLPPFSLWLPGSVLHRQNPVVDLLPLPLTRTSMTSAPSTFPHSAWSSRHCEAKLSCRCECPPKQMSMRFDCSPSQSKLNRDPREAHLRQTQGESV